MVENEEYAGRSGIHGTDLGLSSWNVRFRDCDSEGLSTVDIDCVRSNKGRSSNRSTNGVLIGSFKIGDGLPLSPKGAKLEACDWN